MKASLFASIGALVLVGLTSGCATASKPEAMAYAPAQPLKKHESTVAVTVSGGSETTAMTASQISNDDFAKAIRQSIQQSGVLALANMDPAQLQLDVMIVRVQQPLFGFSMTVSVETSWILKNRATNEVLWQKPIVGTYTAPAGAAFVGATRLRLANEGAARACIEQALRQMSELNVP